MAKITDTQTLILSAAAQRADHIALPLPKGLHGAVAKMVVTKMIANGRLAEVEASSSRGDPLWRETGDRQGTTLMATVAGMVAIGVQPLPSQTTAAAHKHSSVAPVQERPTQRAGTKQAILIAMLGSPEGATIAEINAVLSWQSHTVRGVISGTLRKKLGLTVASENVVGRGTVYRTGCRPR